MGNSIVVLLVTGGMGWQGRRMHRYMFTVITNTPALLALPDRGIDFVTYSKQEQHHY